MYTFCRSELMYIKCIQNVCMQNVSHISANFCIHFAPSSPAHLFAIRGRRKRGPGTLQTRDQNLPN